MPLTAGTRLGPYEILSALGAGGMGEVYQARDTRLKRDVAVKVLPDAFSQDPERLARFQREAEVLATLNHSNIAAIYGLEESNGTRALVMELVDGPTLADRIAQVSTLKSQGSGLPLDEVLRIARQIAEALEAAHEQGIIHRDLKPANIKIREDGTVKVLDFGLAKLADAGAPPNVSATMSPTISMQATLAGVILGTAAYMSPEQARGKAVDKRADNWAFGCVLYEMLTGRRAFDGGEVSDTLAFVLTKDPDWTVLPPDTPASVRRALRRCLEKDQRKRLAHIADARLELDEGSQAPDSTHVQSSAQPASRRREAVLAGGGLVFLLSTIGLAWRLWLQPAPQPRLVRFEITPPDGVRLTAGRGAAELWRAISPDGKTIAYIASANGAQRTVWVQSLDSGVVRELAGTQDASRLFWSPDSQFVAFNAEGKLKKTAVSGGAVQVICDLPGGSGGAWGPEGVILLNSGPIASGGIVRVPASGGQLIPVTALDTAQKETGHNYPDFLPDGRHFLYTANNAAGGSIYVGSLDSKDRTLLVAGANSGARYSPTGHILFYRDNKVVAQQFDPTRLALVGDARPVLDDAGGGPLPSFSLSAAGDIAYLSARTRNETQLVWLDRSGKTIGVAAARGAYINAELSPDDKFVAFEGGGTKDIWVLDMDKGRSSRLTSDPADDIYPVWSPEGRSVAFRSNRNRSLALFERVVGIVAEDKTLFIGSDGLIPSDWTRDGRYLVYSAKNDVWALSIGGGGTKPLQITNTPFDEVNGRVSPDGRWIVYQSTESGARTEVFIQSFPQSGAKQQISAAGGTSSRWSRDGREIYFLAPDLTMMAASIKSSAQGLEVAAPVALFRSGLDRPGIRGDYNVASDGRFLMNLPTNSDTVTVVQNWRELLKK